MLEQRDLKAEINAKVAIRVSKQKNKNSQRLDELKHKIDTVKPYETPLRDYQRWVREYNELLGK